MCSIRNAAVSLTEHWAKRRHSTAVAVGGRGPDLVIGKATTRGFHQSVLSKQLTPPVKWSYRKLTLWWVVVFLSIGWIVFYINTITKKSVTVSCRLRWFFGRDYLPSRSYCCWFSSGGTIRPPTSAGILSGNARSSANAVAL
jgi:hypothetical protein